MTQNVALLQGSFPWLTTAEAAAVAATLPSARAAAGSAGESMRAIALTLEAAGLPPTSSLLLALCARGSKGTAVQVARDTARARFERAQAGPTQVPVPVEAQQRAVSAYAAAPRSEPVAVGDLAPPTSPGAAQEDRDLLHKALKQLEGVAQDFHWLKSTVDTERQLRRAVETNGPLQEYQAPRGPASTAERRNAVQHLTTSLEKDRLKSTFSRDSADGPEE